MKKIICLLTIMIILSISTGCGSKIKTKEGNISVNKENVVVKGNDGSSAVISTSETDKGGTLPSEYPKDIVPLLDDNKIKMSGKTNNDNKKTFTVMYYTKKEISEAAEFYKKLLEGSQEFNSGETNDFVLLSGIKDNYKISISISPESDDTNFKTAVAVCIEAE
jgi:hypothetical protein